MTRLARTLPQVIATVALSMSTAALLSADELSLLETKLLASDGHAFDAFGFAVAISGETAIVGAVSDTPNGYGSGSAYVFVRSNGGWIEQAKLVPADGGPHQTFGWVVDIEGDTAVVGARGDDDNGLYSGSVYVFVRSNGVWSQQAKLLANDGEPGDGLGFSLELQGDTVVAGAWRNSRLPGLYAAGAAYVFEREATTWGQRQKLVASDAGVEDAFGSWIAIDDETLAVGAIFDDDNGADSGSVYMFQKDGSQWVERAKLLASDGAPGDLFGIVDILGDVALVGAERDDDSGIDSGSAYVFRRNGGVWTEERKLLAEDGQAGDWFGFPVVLTRDKALIGAQNDDDNGMNSGSAYLYDPLREWVEQKKLLAGDGESGDSFGFSASISGDRILVGAHQDGDNGPGAGAAYVFEPELQLTVTGTCPGAVTLSISGAPPNSEVGALAAANSNGWRKGGRQCAGTWFEIGEPLQLPPVWIFIDANGNGSAGTTLDPDHCWLEVISLLTCETSAAVEIP